MGQSAWLTTPACTLRSPIGGVNEPVRPAPPNRMILRHNNYSHGPPKGAWDGRNRLRGTRPRTIPRERTKNVRYLHRRMLQ